MRYVKIPKQNIPAFLEYLKEYGNLYAPVRISEKFFDFREIDDVSLVAFSYNRTVQPPRKYFYPPEEVLFTFDREEVVLKDAYQDQGPFVIFGVHAYDILGLRIMHTRFIDDQPDPYYSRRKKNAIIIGMSFEPDEHCFSNLREADFVDAGFDLFLHELPDGYLIRVGGVMGHKIIDGRPELFMDYTKEDVDAMVEIGARQMSRFRTCEDWDNMRYLLELRENHPMWKRESDKCLGCGNCTLTCPTCRCYDVKDIPDLDGRTGKRIRFWDSCQFRSHGLVAGNHNFRETKEDRFKNRYMCKNAYSPRVTTAYCVGCGRCSYFCPAGINYKKNLMEIRGGMP